MMDKKILRATREAIKADDLDTLRELFHQHEGLIAVSTIFGSWLHEAAEYGKLRIAEYLINCGLDVNAKGDTFGGNPLRTAVAGGRLEMVKFLYEHGAVLDVSNPEVNPLFGAIPRGHVEIAKFLIDAGIDITASYPIGDLDECDAYEFASQWGQTEIKNYIKEKLDSLK